MTAAPDRAAPPPPARRSVSEEDVGGCGQLTKLVLKFTTASESDVQPSCEVGSSIAGGDGKTDIVGPERCSLESVF